MFGSGLSSSVVTSLKDLLDTALRDGWAIGALTPDQIEQQARLLRWTPTPVRRGESSTVTLRSVTREQARPRSLSAIYGRGPQPLHTDGAHLQKPPDVVVLYSENRTPTDTLLWRASRDTKNQTVLPMSALSGGMFLVENGVDSFYCPAKARGTWRYDPGCMSPCDARARLVAEFVTDQRELATRHRWDRPGLALVVDNRQVLHARDGVSAGDEQRTLTRMAFMIEQVN